MSKISVVSEFPSKKALIKKLQKISKSSVEFSVYLSHAGVIIIYSHHFLAFKLLELIAQHANSTLKLPEIPIWRRSANEVYLQLSYAQITTIWSATSCLETEFLNENKRCLLELEESSATNRRKKEPTIAPKAEEQRFFSPVSSSQSTATTNPMTTTATLESEEMIYCGCTIL